MEIFSRLGLTPRGRLVVNAGLWRSGRPWCALVLLAVLLGCGDAEQLEPRAGNKTNDRDTRLAEHQPTAGTSTPPLDNSEWRSQIDLVIAGESSSLRVTRQSIGSSDLNLLQQVPEITELLLDAGVVTDLDVAQLAKLSKLEHLRLRNSPLSDIGLASLAQGDLRNLRVLNLPQAKVTAAGIEQLMKFSSLVQLRLGGAAIDDRAVEAIAKLPNLRSLHLIQPNLTDLALDKLAEAEVLSSLYIDGCALSDQAWERLFDRKPGLHVHIDQAHHDLDPSAHSHQ